MQGKIISNENTLFHKFYHHYRRAHTIYTLSTVKNGAVLPNFSYHYFLAEDLPLEAERVLDADRVWEALQVVWALEAERVWDAVRVCGRAEVLEADRIALDLL